VAIINSNISALRAQASLSANQVQLNKAMERLSTGVRINSAKDDAAGLAISNRMTTDIRGYAVAMRNANDGISLTQVAEGHLAQITDNLQRIRELAVQSSNASNSTADRQVLNLEATQLVAEIDRIANNSKFNNINLLDGTFVNKDFQIGAGNLSSDRINLGISSAKAGALGVGSGSSYSTSLSSNSAVGATALAAGELSINGYTVGAAQADGVSYSGSTASGIAVAAAINATSDLTKVTAQTNATTVTGATLSSSVASYAAIAAGDIKINGVDIGGIYATAGATTADAIKRGSAVAAAVNKVSAQTGVTATFSTSTGAVSLNAADGRNITIEGVAATTLAATGLTSDTVANGGITTRSKVNLISNNQPGITVSSSTAAALTAAGLSAGYTAATATAGAGVSSLDLSSVPGSQNALSILDAAISTVNQTRAQLGAYQNRLQFAVSDLQIGSDNMSASRSRILDTDYASETTNLAKAQIVSQAATAMLAQANQQPQTVLALLK